MGTINRALAAALLGMLVATPAMAQVTLLTAARIHTMDTALPRAAAYK